jgi:hypothetical protein
MNLLNPRHAILVIGLLLSSLPVFTQQLSSVYLDSRIVADYLASIQDPFIDASQLGNKISTKLKIYDADNLWFSCSEEGKKYLQPEKEYYTLVLNLDPGDTVIVVGTIPYYITSDSPDTVSVYPEFRTLVDQLEWHVKDRHFILPYGIKDGEQALNAVNRFANHVYYNQARIEYYDFNLDELKGIYNKNPFLYGNRGYHKGIDALDWGSIDDVSSNYLYFYDLFQDAYPWQTILNGDSTLNLAQQVSFEDIKASYRDQIFTSEQALTLASEQIDRSGKESGLLDAKTIAVGLSDFIAERAQEELNLTFFDRFKLNMLDTNELTILFPNTRDLLVDFEISNYKTLLSHARYTFETDLENIGLNFPKILSLPKYEALENDPNVFNLALIYSLADLAYKEYPVEDIVLYACQLMNNRKSTLNRSIGRRLSKALTEVDSNQDYRIKTELNMLRDQSVELLDSFRRVDGLIGSAYYMLYEMADRLGEFAETDIERKRLSDYNNSFYDPRVFFGSWQQFVEEGAEEMLVKGEMITGERKVFSLDYYYSDRIPVYLEGRRFYSELYGETPQKTIYNQVFREGTDNSKENIVKGIEMVRSLRNESLGESLRRNVEKLKRTIDITRQIENEYLMAIQPDSTQSELYFALTNKVDLIGNAMESELDFWSIILEKNDFHLAGLNYLRRLYADFKARSVFIVPEDTPDVATYLAQNFNIEFKEWLSFTDRELKNYKPLLDEQLEKIARHSGLAVNSEMDQLKKQYIRLYEQKEKLLEDFRVFSANGERRKSVMFQEALQMNGYEVLNNKLNAGEEVDQAYVMQLFADANTATKESPEYIRIDSLINNRYQIIDKERLIYNQQIDSLEEVVRAAFNNPGASSSIEEINVLSSKNSYIKKYEALLDVPDVNKADELLKSYFNPIDSVFALIAPAINEVEALQNKLGTTLDALEVQYCPKLVKAERNAKNLSASMELSMHLLSAFRNPAAPKDSMFVVDTTVVQVSIQREAGITQTFDTLRINEKYLSDEHFYLPGSRWLSNEEFAQLKSDSLQWDLFLGMLYERMSRVNGAPGFSATGIALLTNKFFDVLHEMDIHKNKVRYKKALRKNLDFSDYYPFIKTTVDLFNIIINTPTVGEDQSILAEQFEDIRKVSEISDQALSLYENMYAKNYSNAIRNAMSLLSIFTDSEYDSNNPIYDQSLRDRQNKSADKTLLKAYKKEARKSRRAINAVLTYGTFMADMIDAQTSEQVKNILKSATLPPGSSRIKREVVTNFTINSYLGGAVAYDRIQDDLPGLDKGAFSASLSVPIGFTYSFSPDNIFKQGGSFSIHVPVLDLGAITAFRSNPSNDNYKVEQLPELSWSNLFAPGVFFVWNIKDSPFSLGAGGQIGPQLREIENVNTAVITSVNSTRFPAFFFGVDVPFFNLHTGAKKIVVD